MPKYNLRGNPCLLFAGLAIVLLLSSCANQRNFFYFNDLPNDSTVFHLKDINWPITTIQRDDILEIKIAGKNEVTAGDFNKKSGGFGSAELTPQYVVSRDGDIELFMIGKVKVEGLTVDECKKKITALIAKYLVEPVVNVRMVNFKFTVLGEVKSPGSYSIPNEKITV